MKAKLIYCPRCGVCGPKLFRPLLDGFSGVVGFLSGLVFAVVVPLLAITAAGVFWPFAIFLPFALVYPFVTVPDAFNCCCRECGYPAVIALSDHQRRRRDPGYCPPHKLNLKSVIKDGQITRWA